jgi:hypothetical protein
MTVSRERGDMKKDLRATLSRGDEPETAIITPFCESAIDSHTKGLTSKLRRAVRSGSD